jgi:hypothetical protein
MAILGTLGSLNILLSADTVQFSSAMEKAAYTAEKNLNKIGIGAKLSAAAVVTAFVAITKNALSFADSIGDMAERLGMTSRQMSILAYSAKMSDVEVSSLEATIRKMYVSAYNSADAFSALGVKVKDSSGRLRGGYDIFVDVIDAFSKIPDGVGKSSAAVEIFGKSGADIVPLLNAGKQGIEEFRKEAEALGVVIDEQTARNADRWDKFIKKAQEGLKGLGIAIVDYASSWQNLLVPFSIFIKKNEDFLEAEKERSQILAEQAAAYEQAAAAAEKKKKLEEEGVKLTQSLHTAQEKYDEEIAKYNELLSSGAINQETYNRAIEKSKTTLSESTLKTNKMKDAAKDLGFTFQSAFEDAIIDGKNLSDVLSALLEDIERIILRTAVTGPLADALSAGVSSFFGIKSKSAHGNIFSYGNLVPFSTGGLITRPTLFPMANGGTGLAGEEGDEAIMPLFRTSNGDLGVKSGNSRGVEINVYAPEGSKVSQNSQTIGDKEQINIMIDEATSAAVGNPGSKTFKALKNSFGLRQSLTVR